MLKSSIIGKEFVNYRKITNEHERVHFSNKIRKEGVGNIPIVIDSVDKELTLLLAKHDPIFPRNIRFGFEIFLHMDHTVKDLLLVGFVYILNQKNYIKKKILLKQIFL